MKIYIEIVIFTIHIHIYDFHEYHSSCFEYYWLMYYMMCKYVFILAKNVYIYNLENVLLNVRCLLSHCVSSILYLTMYSF